MLDAEYWSATAAGGHSATAGFSHSEGICAVWIVCDVMCHVSCVWCDVSLSRILCVLCYVMNLVMCCVMHHVDTSPMVTSPAPWCRQHPVCYCWAGEHSEHRSPCCAGSRVPTLWWHSTFYKYPHLSPGDNEEIGLEKMFLFMNGCKNVKISQIVSAFTFPSPNICTINGKVQIFPTWNFAGHVNTRYWYSHSAAPMPPTSCFLPLGWGECNDKCRLQARLHPPLPAV